MEIVQPHFGEAFMEMSIPIPIILIIFARDYLFAALINIAILAIKPYLGEAFTEIISIIISARDYLFAALINKPPLVIEIYISEAFIETTKMIIFARDYLLACLINTAIALELSENPKPWSIFLTFVSHNKLNQNLLN